MAEIRWHIIEEEGNPEKDGEYLTVKRYEGYDGEYFYFGADTMKFAEGWNCYRNADGEVWKQYEIKDVYAWADIEHLYDELPARKEKEE